MSITCFGAGWRMPAPRFGACLLAAAGAYALAFGAPEMDQEFSLVNGWNAIRVEVGPKEDANTLFRDWPVEWVALYDSAAFLDTKQFSSRGSTEGVAQSGYRMWRRGDPGASSFSGVPADSVLVCYATNTYSGRLTGTPVAPRITWHKSATNETMNVVGFSTWGETTTDAYFSGIDVGPGSFYVFGGGDTSKPFVMLSSLVGTMTFNNASVLAVDSSKITDWSGVLNVSPRDGIDFGTELSQGYLDIRNDGAANRTVSVQMHGTATAEMALPIGLHVQLSGAGAAKSEWMTFDTNSKLERDVPAGATLRVTFALDRTQLTTAAGQEYGALLEIRDENGGSKMRVVVPISAKTGAQASVVQTWPRGVWLAAAELDTVTYRLTRNDTSGAGGTGDVPAGGKMKVRLPVYVDADSNMSLLQQVWFGRDTNGVLRAFSGAVKTAPEPLSGIKRLSSPFLPTDQPVLAMEGTFGAAATCPFVVGETSKINPMRHARHPQHDGLRTDFATAAPSGDDLANYAGTIKPETFSITNRVVFTWDANEGVAWNPEEKLSGELVWEFDGLRHEGTVRAKGKFVMKRISPVAVVK